MELQTAEPAEPAEPIFFVIKLKKIIKMCASRYLAV